MDKWMLGRWQPSMQPDGAGGANGNDGGADAQEGQTEADPQAEAQEPLPFKDLLEKHKEYRTEVDRMIGKAAETARQTAEREMEAKIAEAERVATMTAEEKAEHDLQQRLAALNARDAEVLKRELTADAKVRLADKGLDTRLSGLLDYSSKEAWEQSLQLVEAAIPEMLQADRKKQLAGMPPAKGETKPLNDPNTMTATERMRLKTEDPAQYKKLFGG